MSEVQVRPKRSKARRPPRRKKALDTHLQKAIDHRAAYVLQLIEDEPWRDGRYGWLAEKVRERFRISRNPSEKAVTRAYELMSLELEKRVPRLVTYLDNVHRATIAMGFKEDGRLITSAAAELRKLHAIGEPDRINVTGHTTSSLTIDDVNLLAALKYTNAQRQAEIDKLRSELTESDNKPAPAPTPPTEIEPEEFSPEAAIPLDIDDDPATCAACAELPEGFCPDHR